MFGIGMQELVIILAVALIFIGPKKLPELAKQIAKGMRELRRASDDLKASIMVDIDDETPAERWRRERMQQAKQLPPVDDDGDALIKNSKLAGSDIVSREDGAAGGEETLSQADEEARDQARIDEALQDPAVKDAIAQAKAASAPSAEDKPDDDKPAAGESLGRA